MIPAAPADALAESIASWALFRPAEPLVFALEHHYTQRGLSRDLLKGADRKIADRVASAAEKAECVVHLAQVSRHLLQHADDGSYGRRDWHHRTPPRDLEIGESFEDELLGTEWTDMQGKKQPWGNIPFELPAIVSSTPIDEWKPTSEEYEGFTGNAGNTLDRWYHRSAIVVWRRDHHFEVVAASGAAGSIPLFSSMAAKLAKTPKKRFESARGDCIRFARAIIARWPQRRAYSSRDPGASVYDDFADRLLLLHDPDAIATFLTKLAETDQSLRLNSFVVAACREFGAKAFAQELKKLIVSRPDQYGGKELPFRDAEWLSAFCLDKRANTGKAELARELCELAVERFCEPLPPHRRSYDWRYDRREASVREKTLAPVLKALAGVADDGGLARVTQFVQENPDEFRLDLCQVPGLKTLIPWSRQRLKGVHPQLASWLAAVRRQLESATASRPAPPTDWSRPAEGDCKCQYCAELKDFLADATSQVGRIAAREDLRQHLIHEIAGNRYDVTHTLERRGSPFSLVLTKTKGSFERAVKRFHADCKLLSELPAAES